MLLLLEHLLTSSDAASVDELGWDVAVSGYTALVGAPRGIQPGSAYVFVREGGGYTEQAILNPSLPEGFDAFGMAVDIDGDVAVVGARSSGASGRVFVFERTGTAWEETSFIDAEDVLVDPDEFSFGNAVAVSGDRMLVTSSARVYAFERDGDGWALDIELTSLGVAGGVWSVDLRGDRAIVGSLNDNAYVYERHAGGWQFAAVLLTEESQAGTGFGRAVAIDGNLAVVGAPEAPSNDTEEGGAAYAFVRTAAGWVFDEKLEPLPPDVHDIHDYGWSIALGGGRLVVGDPSDMHANAGAGAAWLYERSGGAWIFDQRVVASDAESFDRFAWSVDLSAFALLAGAPEASENHFREGLAYAYDLPFDPPVGGNGWLLVARILFGLTGGGGGVILLPGSGPVPIDPDPFFGRPLFALFADDAAERDLLIDQVRRLWPGERVAVVDDARSALALPDTLALVTPGREALTLVGLLLPTRAALRRTAPVVVFLDADGPMARVLRLLARL